MTDSISLALIKSVIDSKKDLVVIFENEEPVMSNMAFNKFFGVSALEEYKETYGLFVDNFVPHPSYFNKEKIESSKNWFEAILLLPEMDRIVSMLSASFDPHAFSVEIDQSVSNFTIATFSDITQSLIKRIMIENNASIDIKSGAYAKKYFLEISQSYNEAAVFNEKVIGAILITLEKDDGIDISDNEEMLKDFVNKFKSSTRQDDMLIRWNKNVFLLVSLVDNENSAEKIVKKLQDIAIENKVDGVKCDFTLRFQKEDENIKNLIDRVVS